MRESFRFLVISNKNENVITWQNPPSNAFWDNSYYPCTTINITVFFGQFYFNTTAQNELLCSFACFGSGFTNFWRNFFFLRLNWWSSWTTVIIWICWWSLSFWVSDIFGLTLFSLITCGRSTGKKFFLWKAFILVQFCDSQCHWETMSEFCGAHF